MVTAASKTDSIMKQSFKGAESAGLSASSPGEKRNNLTTQFQDSMNMRKDDNEDFFGDDANWYELRPVGEIPERRGYHSSFISNDK